MYVCTHIKPEKKCGTRLRFCARKSVYNEIRNENNFEISCMNDKYLPHFEQKYGA